MALNCFQNIDTNSNQKHPKCQCFSHTQFDIYESVMHIGRIYKPCSAWFIFQTLLGIYWTYLIQQHQGMYENCMRWNNYNLLLLCFIPIPLRICFHLAQILSFDNKFTSYTNFNRACSVLI